jgi:hypothetical protein
MKFFQLFPSDTDRLFPHEHRLGRRRFAADDAHRTALGRFVFSSPGGTGHEKHGAFNEDMVYKWVWINPY